MNLLLKFRKIAIIFSLFYIIKVPKEAIYIYISKTGYYNSCFAKLRAISNLFSFFIHPDMSEIVNNAAGIGASHSIELTGEEFCRWEF